MIGMVRPTTHNETGPWLLSVESLEALDKILDDQWKELIAYSDELLRDKAEQYVREYPRQYIGAGEKEDRFDRDEAVKRAMASIQKSTRGAKSERALTLHFKNKKRLIVESFKAASKHADVADELPVAFHLKYRVGEIQAELTIREGAELDLFVLPDDARPARELFGSLYSWTRSVRSGKWLRFWHEWASLLWLMTWLLFVVVLSVSVEKVPRSEWVYVRRAEELLKEGVTADNQAKAVEVVLGFVAELDKPEELRFVSLGWTLGVSAVLAAVGVVLWRCPQTVIALGKGQAGYRAWKRWLRFISVTLPMLLFSSLLWPKIVDAVNAFAFRS